MKGGYQIIDLCRHDYTLSEPETCVGLYEDIEAAQKAILLEGLTIGGVNYRPAYVTADLSNTDFVISVYGHTITIADDDTVTITKP